MIIFLWYCPQCDKLTQNFKVCPKCKEGAVYQKFLLWPVEDLTDEEKRKVEIMLL